ncbi:hypothetical protein [Bacillus paramycoides]|uniref:hypothetical protein n=1 Tax=Bacillus paramycoides TaxID=2026194 RepID=UPI002E1E730F|nr:hypothetical protein [Bacillus paramycoides]
MDKAAITSETKPANKAAGIVRGGVRAAAAAVIRELMVLPRTVKMRLVSGILASPIF